VSAARRQLSTRYKLVFGLLVALLVILGVEVAYNLRYGLPPPSGQIARMAQCRVRTTAQDAKLDCSPGELEDVTVPLKPTAGRPRIVFLGASSVREPRQRPFPSAVAAALPQAEVINLAVPGLSVAGVARISSELEPLEPDLVVIYAGHNEFSEDVFSGRIASLKLWTLPIYALLEWSWIHRGLNSLLTHRITSVSKTAQSTHPTDDDFSLRGRDRVFARYRADLETAVEASPAPVVLTTLLRNPDRGPTGTWTAGRPECGAAVQATARAGASPEALARLEQDCGDQALTWWIRCRIARQAGDQQAALVAWHRSMALDALPLRAPAEADDVVRQVAAETGATLVDLEQEVGATPPGTWFVDPIHFSGAGVDGMARVLVPVLREELSRPR